MVSVMLDDPKGAERRLLALVHPILEPSWLEYNLQPLMREDHARAAEMLDLLIDILEGSGIGVQRLLVTADEVVDCLSPRKLHAPCNDTGFDLSVNPQGGLNLYVSFEDKTFIEHGLSFEAVSTLILSFTNLRMAPVGLKT